MSPQPTHTFEPIGQILQRAFNQHSRAAKSAQACARRTKDPFKKSLLERLSREQRHLADEVERAQRHAAAERWYQNMTEDLRNSLEALKHTEAPHDPDELVNIVAKANDLWLHIYETLIEQTGASSVEEQLSALRERTEESQRLLSRWQQSASDL